MKKIITILFYLIGISSFAQFMPGRSRSFTSIPSEVSFVRVSSTNWGSSINSISLPIQVDGSGAVLVVFVGRYYGGATTSVKFNTTETMTLAGATNLFDSGGVTDCHYLINPTITTADVIITFSSPTSEGAAIVMLFNGASSVGTASLNMVNGTSINVSPSTSIGEIIADGLGWFDDSKTYTPGSGQTQRASSQYSSQLAAIRVSTKSADAGSTTMSWSINSSTIISQIAVAIKP